MEVPTREEMRREIERLRRQNSALQDEKAKLEVDVEDLQTQLTAATATNEEQAARIETLETSQLELEDELEDAQERMKMVEPKYHFCYQLVWELIRVFFCPRTKDAATGDAETDLNARIWNLFLKLLKNLPVAEDVDDAQGLADAAEVKVAEWRTSVNAMVNETSRLEFMSQPYRRVPKYCACNGTLGALW